MVGAVYLSVQASLDQWGTERQKPNIEQANSESEAGEAQEVTKSGALKIKAVVFKVPEHTLYPSAPMIEPDNQQRAGQVGGK